MVHLQHRPCKMRARQCDCSVAWWGGPFQACTCARDAVPSLLQGLYLLLQLRPAQLRLLPSATGLLKAPCAPHQIQDAALMRALQESGGCSTHTLHPSLGDPRTHAAIYAQVHAGLSKGHPQMQCITCRLP